MIAEQGEGRACVREYALDFGMKNGPDQASRPAFADCAKLPGSLPRCAPTQTGSLWEVDSGPSPNYDSADDLINEHGCTIFGNSILERFTF